MWKLLIVVLIFLSALKTNVDAGVSSIGIMRDSVAFSCVAWKPTGVCFWLKCGFGCSIKTSLKVKHYNPDAIVQVYQEPGEVPWDEMSFVSALSSFGQSGVTPANVRQLTGSYHRNKKKRSRKASSKVISRNVDVIGSPGLLPVSELFGASGFGCKSGVKPFIPYFVSTLDFYSWRFPYTDFLKTASFVPGMREVGERKDGENEKFLFVGRFGNVYPRIGSLMQNDTYKASAVFAQRAADIVTDKGAMHIYNYLGEKNGRDGWWPPGQIKEWTSEEGKWQMLYPRSEKRCHIFGEPSTRDGGGSEAGLVSGDGYEKRRSRNGDYAWQLWRPYECCKKKGQKLLFTVGFGN